jgi:hypothetical protein
MKRLILKLLYKIPHQDMGWEEIQEKFTRFTLLSNRFFTVHLHRLEAPQWHPDCHDHPWSFVTLILRGGYEEQVGDKVYWRRPGTVLYRPAEFSHNVRTRGVAWSLIVRGRQRREWGFQTCRTPVTHPKSSPFAADVARMS